MPFTNWNDHFRCIVLSIVHLSREDQNDLYSAILDNDGMVLERDTGYLIKLYEIDHDDPNYNLGFGSSESIKAIIMAAYAAGYRMIDFNADGPVCDDFPVYDNT